MEATDFNNIVVIGKEKLSLEQFYNVAVNNFSVDIDADSMMKIQKSREAVKQIIDSGEIVYGINTGFGSLSNKIISEKDLETLQRNLIVSHAIGCGDPTPKEVVRGMLLLRLVCICQGHSGVRPIVAETLVHALNKNYIPYVPKLGTVGASGDLAPLSHLIMSMIGEGLAYDFETNKYIEAKKVMTKLNIKPLVLKAKEGLALNNGTQFITSYTALATYHANKLLDISNKVAALSVEALHGVNKAFDEKIHLAKPHSGQIYVAKQMA
ncbi:MAG: aromatic amino acid lyase, partial [Nitrosopumilus sp.]|nr:aromatic amino acid lyase [Nitrosopumilus sp.]